MSLNFCIRNAAVSRCCAATSGVALKRAAKRKIPASTKSERPGKVTLVTLTIRLVEKYRTVEQIENSIKTYKKSVTKREEDLQKAIAAKAKAANLSSTNPLGDPTLQARFGGQEVTSAIESAIKDAKSALGVAVDPALTINTNQPHPTADVVLQIARRESTISELSSSVSTKPGYFSSLIDRFSAVMARFSSLRGSNASPTNNGLGDPTMSGGNLNPRLVRVSLGKKATTTLVKEQGGVDPDQPSIALVNKSSTTNKPQG